jgi:hypothetical protein
VNQLNRVAQITYNHLHHQDTYPFLDLREVKATSLTNTNTVTITANNKLTVQTTFLTPITYHYNCPETKSIPGSEAQHNCPPMTTLIVPTENYNRTPESTATMQPYTFKKTSTVSKSIKPSPELTKTDTSRRTTSDVKELKTKHSIFNADTNLDKALALPQRNNFQQALEQQLTKEILQSRLTTISSRLQKPFNQIVWSQQQLPSTNIYIYLSILMLIIITAVQRICNRNISIINNNHSPHNTTWIGKYNRKTQSNNNKKPKNSKAQRYSLLHQQIQNNIPPNRICQHVVDGRVNHQKLRTLISLLQYGRRFRYINPRLIYMDYVQQWEEKRMEKD